MFENPGPKTWEPSDPPLAVWRPNEMLGESILINVFRTSPPSGSPKTQCTNVFRVAVCHAARKTLTVYHSFLDLSAAGISEGSLCLPTFHSDLCKQPRRSHCFSLFSWACTLLESRKLTVFTHVSERPVQAAAKNSLFITLSWACTPLEFSEGSLSRRSPDWPE